MLQLCFRIHSQSSEDRLQTRAVLPLSGIRKKKLQSQLLWRPLIGGILERAETWHNMVGLKCDKRGRRGYEWSGSLSCRVYPESRTEGCSPKRASLVSVSDINRQDKLCVRWVAGQKWSCPSLLGLRRSWASPRHWQLGCLCCWNCFGFDKIGTVL